MTEETKETTSLWVRLWPVYVIAAGLLAAWAFGLFDYLSLETLREQNGALQAFVADNTVLSFAAYILVYALATVFMLPGALWITIAGGLLFGLVLLVEDNEVNQLVARRLLEHMGVTVVTARNGHEALEKVRQRDFDCILMDVQMPVLDGMEATRQLRQWEREQGRAPIPVIALTANAMEEERERCFTAGMDDHLAKPFRRQQLSRVLTPYLTPERAQSGR